MQTELDFLTGMGAEQLHGEGCKRSKRLAGAECLLAVDKTKLYWARDYSSTVQYAVSELGMDRHKAAELLRAAWVLQALPLMAEAFRRGEIGWSKLREVTRVATADTEAQWLAFARAHTAELVARAVVMAPTQYKQQQAARSAAEAAEAQLTFLEPQALAGTAEQAAAADACAPQAQAPSGASAAPTPASDAPAPASAAPTPASAGPAPASDASVGVTPQTPETDTATLQGPDTHSPPVPPQSPSLIGLNLRLTPDEYALVEQALTEARRRRGRQLRREVAVVEICRVFLAGGSPTGRLKSQVIVHTNAEGDRAWYETERGVLPAQAPAQTKQPQAAASERHDVGAFQMEESYAAASEPHTGAFQMEVRSAEPKAGGGKRRRRRNAIPRKVVRARANGRCERPNCGGGGRLQLHHKVPVSDGGEHSVDNIEMLCQRCHALHHACDFDMRDGWHVARRRSLQARSASLAANPTG